MTNLNQRSSGSSVLDVVVTGAGGFIGRALCRRLQAEGRRILGLSRGDGDVTDAGFWASLPSARALIHLAGRSYVPDSWREPAAFVSANLAGTQHALDWCRKNAARMIFSSAYVYGIPQQLPIRESDPARPNNPYALSKYLCEQCCEFAHDFQGTDVTVLRIFNVFGHGQRREFLLPTLIGQLDTHEIRVMDLTPRRDYIYLPDVVDAFVRSLDAPGGFNRVNIGSGVSHSVSDIVSALQSVAGTSLPVVSTAEPRHQEIPDVQAEISLAARILEWKPAFDLAGGIHDLLCGADHE
ncbi:NAD-dependent epimerase/dehydratase family protein [Ferrovibrio xuzhouensis]|uniref:NAD-dependent epimerase/dehydratase family protein n=1 Tax=Ferrovibrio xuzhouensis TaxID=1576914 RepID=A0ABV7VLA7_9PROT